MFISIKTSLNYKDATLEKIRTKQNTDPIWKDFNYLEDTKFRQKIYNLDFSQRVLIKKYIVHYVNNNFRPLPIRTLFIYINMGKLIIEDILYYTKIITTDRYKIIRLLENKVKFEKEYSK